MKITYLPIAQLGRGGAAGEITARLARLRNINPAEEHQKRCGRWAAGSGSRAVGMRDGSSSTVPCCATAR